MDFLELAKYRWSVRGFSDRKVEKGLLDDILKAARLAPTACNKQPVKLLVVQTEAALEKLAESTPFSLFEAPLAIVVCASASQAWNRSFDNDNSAVVDAAIVGTHILMQVADSGLGTTWIGCFDPAVVKKNFQLEENWQPIAIFPIGYADKGAKPAAMHNQRKGLDELVQYF